jgi:hypothetical protein
MTKRTTKSKPTNEHHWTKIKLALLLMAFLAVFNVDPANAGSPFPYGSHSHYIQPWSGDPNIVYQLDGVVFLNQQGSCRYYRGDLYHLTSSYSIYHQYLGYWGNGSICDA